jgi:hypothetical protein
MHTEPSTLWEVSAQLGFNEALQDADDPRYVDTSPARELGYTALFRDLGVNLQSQQIAQNHPSKYVLFCGHRGTGKSTELRRIRQQLNKPGLFKVILIDAGQDVGLDLNNLEYPDVCLALARALCEQLKDAEGIVIDPVFLTPLEKWFTERVLVTEAFREWTGKAATGADGKWGIPFLSEFFLKFSTAFKTGTKRKEEARTILKSSFGEFAEAFNKLILHVEERMERTWQARRLLFIVDGTDRLTGKDSDRFFIEDVYQLRQLRGLFLYCAPIHLVHASSAVRQAFDHICKVPALKLADKFDPRRPETRVEHPEARDVMRQLILRRAPARFFQPDPLATGDWSTVDHFIRISGGHLRDLIRLLNYAFQSTTTDLFDLPSAQAAEKKLATDYRHILKSTDYDRLAQIDTTAADANATDEETRALLYNLALLEYNSFWWQSHPAVRTLPSYQAALAKLPLPPP